jgi:bifunctional UDP-N-acetylglucosamine pyrophosphorylase/glucosamine-1-phosphate N-acetyltransferase
MTAPTVVVLAAGQGTRMRSEVPKVLHDLCGRPMGLWPVVAALEAGAGRVVVVDSPARPLAEVLPEGVELVVQPVSNGTGGAVLAAAEALDPAAPVVVLSGDVPLVSAAAIAELVAAHVAGGAAATMATTVLEDPAGYGRVVRDERGAVARVVETKQAGDATPEELALREVNTGIYAFDGAALLEVLPRLSADNAQGELYLPQALDLLRADGAVIAAHAVDDPRLVLGVNDRWALAQVRALAQRAILERHARAGVTVVDPAATWVDVDVRVGVDARLEPGTSLRGATEVGAGAVVGPHTTALDSSIGERAVVRVSWLDHAVVGAGASVGPFAYLRPGAVLGEGSKVGTFVEVKNSDLGAGVKIPHLSYIGDADVGERSNLGAGTITANYDGHSKHRTTIGRRVRGGVDTAFVAPVVVGDDAYTAAGSVITEDVPPGALGVARARQVNREGYAQRRGDARARAQSEVRDGNVSDGKAPDTQAQVSQVAADNQGDVHARGAEAGQTHDAPPRGTRPRAPAPVAPLTHADDPQKSH